MMEQCPSHLLLFIVWTQMRQDIYIQDREVIESSDPRQAVMKTIIIYCCGRGAIEDDK